MFLAVFCKMPYMRYAWQSSFFNNLILCNIRVKGCSHFAIRLTGLKLYSLY